MDFLKKAQGMMNQGSSGSHSTPQTNPSGHGTTQGTTGQKPAGQDYGDKAFAAIGKKFGYSGNAQTNEAITDGIRGQYEKATGKKVPEKFSN